jgi:lipid A 3-O-deacylase
MAKDMRVRMSLRVAFLFAAVISFPSVTFAQDQGKPDCQAYASVGRPLQVSFLYENDFFASSDRNYTSGALLSMIWGQYEKVDNDPCSSQWSRLFAQRVNGLIDSSLPQRNFEFSIGQQLYTPGSRRRTDLQVNDRPFAGWLFGRWALHAFDAERSQSLWLDVGMVGPAAGGEASQNFFHGLQGYTPFRGWGNQLRNELGVLIATESRREILRVSSVSLIGHYGGGIGNIETYLNTGLKLQFGRSGFNDVGIQPAFRSANVVGRVSSGSQASNRGLQGFLGVDLRAVAHNIFLDGNTNGQSHHVPRRPGVGELSAGLSWRLAGVDFAYTHSYRSREFYGQTYTHAFGGLHIGMTMP